MSPVQPAAPALPVDPSGWDEAVANTDGPQLVIGGPGTGKTEFLVRRATHLLTVGQVRPEAIKLFTTKLLTCTVTCEEILFLSDSVEEFIRCILGYCDTTA